MSKPGNDGNEETREEVFAKKVNLWQKQTRGDWEWSKRPSYRQKTVNAALTQQSLVRKMKSDSESLNDVEASLNAMSSYMEGKEERHETIDQILGSGIRVDDMLAMKQSVKEKILSSRKTARMQEAEVAAVSDKAKEDRPPEPETVKQNITAPVESNSSRKPALLDMDGLTAARMHNKHRQMALQQKQSARGEEQCRADGPSLRYRTQGELVEDHTFLTGMSDMIEEDAIEEGSRPHVPPEPSPVQGKGRSVSAGPRRSTLAAVSTNSSAGGRIVWGWLDGWMDGVDLLCAY